MTTENNVVRTPKRKLQKISGVISYISFFIAIISGGYLMTIIDTADMVMKSSVGAICFFFFMVALVLHTIATTDLPNLKIETKD